MPAAIEWLLQTPTGQQVEQQIFHRVNHFVLLTSQMLKSSRYYADLFVRGWSVPRADQAITDLWIFG
jgi:hypothetical protein